MKKALFTVLLILATCTMAQAQEKASRTIITCDTAACESFYWNANGQTYTSDAIETYVSGDTLYVLNLTIDHQVTTAENVTVDRCSYTWRNVTYSQSGVYRDSIPTQTACDSLFVLTLTVTNTEADTSVVVSCGAHMWNDSLYTVTGVYVDTTHLFNNTCTHLDVLDLTVNALATVYDTVVNCGTYLWDGDTLTASCDTLHIVSDTVVGCDSIYRLHLTVLSSDTTLSEMESCGNYTWHDSTYTATGSYLDSTYTADSSCIHFFQLNLTVNPSIHFYDTMSLCGRYVWGTDTLTASCDTLHVVSDTVLGCDTLNHLHLTITVDTADHVTDSACGRYIWLNNDTLTVSGEYDTLLTDPVTYCATYHSLSLSIINGMNTLDSMSRCGDYRWYDSTYTATGTYTHVTHNADTTLLCDTTHTLVLTVLVDTAAVEKDSACLSRTWRGHTFSATGVYNILDTNSNTHCVTYRTLNLKIKTPRQGHTDTTMNVCDQARFRVSTWSGLKNMEFKRDTTFDTMVYRHIWNDCWDSTIHLTVILRHSSYSDTNVYACDSFYWDRNKTTYRKTPSDTVRVRLTGVSNVENCDSIHRLILSVRKSPVITAINGEWHLNAGDTAVLYPTATEGSAYRWTYGNQSSTDDTLVIPNVQGNLDVTLYATLAFPEDNNLACHDTSWITIVTFVGIDPAGDVELSLYPNPTVGQLNIESGAAIRQVAIYNALGQEVSLFRDLGTKGLLNLSSLAKGAYSLRIALENGETVIRKIVITR